MASKIMNRTKRLLLSIFTIFCLTTLLAPCVLAEPQKQSFQEWLEKYDAWDKLEKEYAHEADGETPEGIVKRAEVYLNLNSPQKALEIIEMTPPFADKATETRRLWIGGQAQRALGDLTKSVLWFSQAAEHADDRAQLIAAFKAEPALESVWRDVWLKMYWAYIANYSLSRNSQWETLQKLASIGLEVWGGPYWENLQTVFHSESMENAKKILKPTVDSKGVPLVILKVSVDDTQRVIKALAALSLEKFSEADAFVSAITQPPLQFFWKSVIRFFAAGEFPNSLSRLVDGNYLKATTFWKGNILAPYSGSQSAWFLGNADSASWKKFRNNILSMTPDKAVKAINNELNSMLISEQTAQLLRNLKLAIAITTGNNEIAEKTWVTVDKKTLPYALRLSGTLLFKEGFSNVLPMDPIESFSLYPTFAALSGAAGIDLEKAGQAPFWIVVSSKNLKELSQIEYPLDKLLRLAYWQQQFDHSPSAELAKRSAYLFNNTTFGMDCLLYLANEAVQARKLRLGAFYLNSIDKNTLDKSRFVRWLDIKTRLELGSGRDKTALKTFKEMATAGLDIALMTRLKMALLYQQKRDFDAAREQLLLMWEKKSEMSTALQAETLFWLGEGEQAQRNYDKALDYYLELAWKYPQENIWALTAMYRAALIYEKRGKYETAKQLLSTVVKRADRKEQKEAAKARISAIDKKMGADKKQTGSLAYPF